jgi:hypothetical protein
LDEIMFRLLFVVMICAKGARFRISGILFLRGQARRKVLPTQPSRIAELQHSNAQANWPRDVHVEVCALARIQQLSVPDHPAAASRLAPPSVMLSTRQAASGTAGA